MSSTNKKRGGIGGFWENLGPEQAAPAEQQPSTARQETAPTRPVGQPTAMPSAPRGRGRPRNDEPKARTTVNMSPRSWRLLEELRHRERIRGRRNATFADLLDEAIALLAEQRGISIDD